MRGILLLSCPIYALSLSWVPVGTPTQRDYILASACAFSDAGDALQALGTGASATDPSTTTLVQQLRGGAWETVESHRPQFPQPYEHFSLRARGGNFYVGLTINPSDSAAAGLSSILRSVQPGGGEDGMEGAYAFASTAWAYDVASDGSARAAMASSDNQTLGLTAYPASGWDAYPAGNAWTPLQRVAAPAGGVAAVTAARGEGALFVAYAEGASAQVEVGATPLNASSQAWQALGAPFGGAGLARQRVPPALAWGSSAGRGAGGVLCAAAHSARVGEVLFACARMHGNGTAAGSWAPPEPALQGAAPGLAPGLALIPTASGGLRLAIAAAGSSSLVSAACELPAQGPPACLPAALPALRFAGAPVTDFDLCAPAPAQARSSAVPLLLVVAAGPADGTGDSLVAMTLQ